jgi:predicted ABC-type exoprotein transport system permease subunit
MEASQSTVFALVFISWGVITVILVVLLSYRATLLREDDPIFTVTSEIDHYQRQQSIIARRSRLAGEIIVLSVISGVLLLACVGFSVY